jgi:hypothetical protein
MANNQGGAIIPYQPTYSIQYKYGDRYGGQNFAKPTTAINTGQAGGPLSAQATLDGEDATQTIVNPTTTSSSGNGETLDSDASGAPGGTGGADFSQFRNQYTPAQPDFGWQYSSTYGDDEYRDPSISGIFNPPEVPPESGFGSGIIDGGDGGDDGFGVTELSPEVNSPTEEYVGFNLLDDIIDINAKNPGISDPDNPDRGSSVGSSGDLGGGTGAGYTNVTGDGYGTEGTDPTSQDAYGGIDGAADAAAAAEAAAQAAEEENNMSNESEPSDGGGGGGADNSQGAGVESGVSDFNIGGLVPAFGMKKRNKDIPNPILQDPFEHYFRRA